eukprot:929376-Amorphochlora_amoeboformis.AAC.1
MRIGCWLETPLAKTHPVSRRAAARRLSPSRSRGTMANVYSPPTYRERKEEHKFKKVEIFVPGIAFS